MRFITVIAAVVSVCLAAPAARDAKFVLHEKRDGFLHHWGKRDRAPSSYVMPIRIALRQKNLENAEKYLYDVSDPKSLNFGKGLRRLIRDHLPDYGFFYDRQALDR